MRLCDRWEHRKAIDTLLEALEILDREKATRTGTASSQQYTMMVADVWGQLGVCYQSISQVDAAVEAYATAVEVDESSHACHANLAVLYGLRGDSRAHEHIATALLLDPNNVSYIQVKQSLQQQASEKDGAA